MFTDGGRNLVARKVGGLTDSCIDFISVGIGARPIPSTIAGVSDTSHQSGPLRQMVHEVARVPVISTLPSDNGRIKCIAELPNTLNCEFTEVALWTHQFNAGSGRPVTQNIAAFDTNENWMIDGTTPLNTIESASGDAEFANHSTEATAGNKSMFSPYDDLLWTMVPSRNVRKEGFRFSTHGVLMRGDSSTLGSSIPYSTPASGGIHLSVNGLPFDTAGPDDELKLSYFVTPTSGTSAPYNVRMLVLFKTTDNKYAKWHLLHNPSASISMITAVDSKNTTITYSSSLRDGDVVYSATNMAYPSPFYWNAAGENNGTLTLKSGTGGSASVSINNIIFQNSVATIANSYFTQTTKLQNDDVAGRTKIAYDTGFLWSNVSEIIVYSTIDSTMGVSSTTHYLGLDALSFVNNDTANPGYGMVAYDIARNYPTRGILTRQGSPTSVVFEVQIV